MLTSSLTPVLFTVLPGKKKIPWLGGDITLKKGVFNSDNNFWDWFTTVKMNTVKRKPVTISLLDESGKPTMTWTLTNARPTKVSSTDLKSTGNEVAIETIEIAFEDLTIESE